MTTSITYDALHMAVQKAERNLSPHDRREMALDDEDAERQQAAMEGISYEEWCKVNKR